MIAAPTMSGDPLDGGRQVAITLGDEVGELVDLLGHVGRRLDLHPTTDALENFGGVEAVGSCCCHWCICSEINHQCHAPTPASASIGRSANDEGISDCQALRGRRSAPP